MPHAWRPSRCAAALLRQPSEKGYSQGITGWPGQRLGISQHAYRDRRFTCIEDGVRVESSNVHSSFSSTISLSLGSRRLGSCICFYLLAARRQRAWGPGFRLCCSFFSSSRLWETTTSSSSPPARSLGVSPLQHLYHGMAGLRGRAFGCASHPGMTSTYSSRFAASRTSSQLLHLSPSFIFSYTFLLWILWIKDKRNAAMHEARHGPRQTLPLISRFPSSSFCISSSLITVWRGEFHLQESFETVTFACVIFFGLLSCPNG